MILPEKASTSLPIPSMERGFTLIEILVVILIIGILTAIAIPAFVNQRQKANDASLRVDIKNAAAAVETALVDYGTYPALNEAAGNPDHVATIYLNDEPEIRILPENAVFWNESGNLPELPHTDGTYMEIIHMPQDFPEAHWVKHDSDYEFCISGSHINGQKYDWKTGSGAVAYDRYLYYDSRLGGMIEPETLFDAVRGKTDEEAAEAASCHGYGIRYVALMG